MLKGGFTLNFGSYGLKSLEPSRVTARQIEAARRAMTRHMKRAGRVWIRIFPDVPVSKNLQKLGWVKVRDQLNIGQQKVKPGRMMFEIDGVPVDVAREALSLAAAKLPVKCKFVSRISDVN